MDTPQTSSECALTTLEGDVDLTTGGPHASVPGCGARVMRPSRSSSTRVGAQLWHLSRLDPGRRGLRHAVFVWPPQCARESDARARDHGGTGRGWLSDAVQTCSRRPGSRSADPDEGAKGLLTLIGSAFCGRPDNWEDRRLLWRREPTQTRWGGFRRIELVGACRRRNRRPARVTGALRVVVCAAADGAAEEGAARVRGRLR